MTIPEWQPLHTAPRDGTVVELTWMDKGRPQEVVPMRWNPAATNRTFPGVRGFWETACGTLTWAEHDPAGAPTHWRSCTVH